MLSPTPGTYGGLSGVSCASAASCTAVGNFSYGTGSGSSILPRALVESWDSRSWSIVPLRSPSVALSRCLCSVVLHVSAAGRRRSRDEDDAVAAVSDFAPGLLDVGKGTARARTSKAPSTTAAAIFDISLVPCRPGTGPVPVGGSRALAGPGMLMRAW